MVKQMNAMVEIELSVSSCIELFSVSKPMGRFLLRYGGITIAAGIVAEMKS